MIRLVIFIFVSLLCAQCRGQVTLNKDVVRLEHIYAGACFTHNNEDNEIDIVLVKTYNDKFLYANSWGNIFDLYSNFAPKGGTPEEIVADLNSGRYHYLGRLEIDLKKIHLKN